MNRRLLILPLLAVAAAYYVWQRTPAAPTASNAPAACTWRSGSGTEVHQGVNFDKLAANTPLQLSVHCQQPLHFQVWSLSAEDGTLLMFPSPKLQTGTRNPLPIGQTVLPGSLDGKEMQWNTREGIVAATTFVAIASTEPLPELDELAPKVRQWSNTIFPDHSMQVTKTAEGQDVLGKPRADWPATLLQQAAAQLREQTEPNGPMQPMANRPGVWISSWKVIEKR